MARRSEEQSRDGAIDDDLEALLDSSSTTETVDASTRHRERSAGNDALDSRRGRILRRLRNLTRLPGLDGSILASIFSLRTFLIALLASVVAAVVVSLVVPFFGSLAALGGIFAVGFGFGLLSDRRRYLEVGLAGGATAALGMLTEFLVLTIAGSGEMLAMIGAGSGLIAALLGHYFGRDLRTGLSRDI